MAFKEPVKLNNIQLTSLHTKCGAKTLKVYANIPNADFDVCENCKPTQEFSCEKSDKVILSLNPMLFQKVTHLAIYVVSNHGSEYSSINNLIVLGQPLGGIDVS